MKKITKEQLRDAIEVFIDTGNPADSIYTQMQEHVKGKGWNGGMEYLEGAKITKREVSQEIEEMIKDGLVKRGTAPGLAVAFCGKKVKNNWLRLA